MNHIQDAIAETKLAPAQLDRALVDLQGHPPEGTEGRVGALTNVTFARRSLAAARMRIQHATSLISTHLAQNTDPNFKDTHDQ